MKNEKELPNIELKPLVRKRDNYKCCFCKRDINGVRCGNDYGSNSVHHIIPKNIGGNNIPSNCITICSDCHYQLTIFNDILIKHIKTNDG